MSCYCLLYMVEGCLFTFGQEGLGRGMYGGSQRIGEYVWLYIE